MAFIDEEYKKKLIERMEIRHAQGDIPPIHQLGRDWSPEERIEEARKGTPDGEWFLMAEKKLMDELKRHMPSP